MNVIKFAMACIIVISILLMGVYISMSMYASIKERGVFHRVYRNAKNRDEFLVWNQKNCKFEIIEIDFKDIEM